MQRRWRYGYQLLHHRRSQDFVWGCTFFLAKKLTFFSRRPQRPSRNMPPNLTRPAKTNLKIDSCSRWRCTSCPGGALTHFPCKLRLKNFFRRPVGGRCTHCTPLATPSCIQAEQKSITIVSVSQDGRATGHGCQ